MQQLALRTKEATNGTSLHCRSAYNPEEDFETGNLKELQDDIDLFLKQKNQADGEQQPRAVAALRALAAQPCPQCLLMHDACRE